MMASTSMGMFASGARSVMRGMGAVTCMPSRVTLLSWSKGRAPVIISKAIAPTA